MRKKRLRLVRDAYKEICEPKEDKHGEGTLRMSLEEEEAKLIEEVKKHMEVQKRKQKEEVEMMYAFSFPCICACTQPHLHADFFRWLA
jgi:hypothetical protein